MPASDLTEAQERAVRAVYDRTTLWAKDILQTTADSAYGVGEPLTYDEFKARLHPVLDNSGAVAVAWCGMFLAIEPDGYTHS